MAKPNYRQQKRQKELSRKSRQAERLQRRTGKLEGDDTTGDDTPVDVASQTLGEGATMPGGPVEVTPSLLPGALPKATP